MKLTRVIKLQILYTAMHVLYTDVARAANHYVRSGATGSGNGSDWTNAFTKLPSTLLRGDTYYIADGTYGSYTFDDAVSGTTIITIKKAIASDHGTNTGWTNTFGDGQAAFTNWAVSTGYYTIDGMTGDKKTGYGFVIHDGSSGATVISIGNVKNVSIAHIDASATVTTCDTQTNLNVVLYAVNGGSNLTIRDSYLHDHNSWAMIGLNGWNKVTFENNYFMNACKKELISARSDINITFRNNTVENAAGTGIIVMENPSGFYIYNNVFYTTNPSYTTTDCLFCNWYGSGMNAKSVYIYGNTFVNLKAETVIGFDNGSDIIVQNNLFYGSNGISWYGNTSHNYNWCYSNLNKCAPVTSEPNGESGTGNIFININSGDFHLKSPTSGGISLPSPYNLDRDGNARGADGTWDRGAFEYNPTTNIPAIESTKIELQIYPNPANTQLTIRTDVSQTRNSRIIIYDLLGKEITNESIEGLEKSMDISAIPNGIYLLKLETPANTVMRKFVVQH